MEEWAEGEWMGNGREEEAEGGGVEGRKKEVGRRMADVVGRRTGRGKNWIGKGKVGGR